MNNIERGSNEEEIIVEQEAPKQVSKESAMAVLSAQEDFLEEEKQRFDDTTLKGVRKYLAKKLDGVSLIDIGL